MDNQAEATSAPCLCPHCAYDLRATPGERCNECGNLFDRENILKTKLRWEKTFGWGACLRQYIPTLFQLVFWPRGIRVEQERWHDARRAGRFVRLNAIVAGLFAAVLCLMMVREMGESPAEKLMTRAETQLRLHNFSDYPMEGARPQTPGVGYDFLIEPAMLIGRGLRWQYMFPVLVGILVFDWMLHLGWFLRNDKADEKVALESLARGRYLTGVLVGLGGLIVFGRMLHYAIVVNVFQINLLMEGAGLDFRDTAGKLIGIFVDFSIAGILIFLIFRVRHWPFREKRFKGVNLFKRVMALVAKMAGSAVIWLMLIPACVGLIRTMIISQTFLK